ncbi:LacI family DNA-binding transcriptional regulator [Sulfobacillus harzensis]|uniref:LacI family transcriptional regulator n=1 Tax=Sulfobacillus harzensis TaxID=2729629 RepID=A0A7Y0Q4I9_9FIRM|nr:LacI family DNA-binding transcriptional regulator [Sulfobacillus harzensis]NMP24677.1 LacI family transcriptional regulator [Sulfobacillus harzensis]
MTTIKDIAKLAGVSYSTVSKALNDSPLVKEDTKQRIFAIARAHNYRRNLLASNLVSGRSRLIGLVFKTVNNPVFGYLANELHAALAKEQYYTILTWAGASIDILEDLRVGALVYWGDLEEDAQLLSRFSESSVPVFVLGNNSPVPFPCLRIDRKRGILSAVQYLKSLGHQRIGLVGNSQEIKTQAFKESLKEAGLPFRAGFVLPGSTTWEDGYRAVKNYRWSSDSPTAFLGVNNLVTRGALRALLEDGVQVPERLSLIGYDDLFDMEHAEVPLTTIGPPLDDMARMAARTVLQLVQRQTVAEETWIEPVLRVRTSTGPVPR